jgi:hypothetical protein
VHYLTCPCTLAQPAHSPRAAAQAGSLPAPLKKIVTAFQMVPDPMQRYKQLLFYASKLKPLAEELHTADNKVQGCVSQVSSQRRASRRACTRTCVARGVHARARGERRQSCCAMLPTPLRM